MNALRSWAKTRSNEIAYSSTGLAAGAMHNVFMFYYVRIFLNKYHVDDSWFNVAQLVYMIWNTLNDPLIGYCQDHMTLPFTNSRRHSILYGAPIWAVAFLVPWFPWYSGEHVESPWIVGLHLTFSLCFYDTLFTYVLLNHACLMTEMSQTQEDRLRRMQYSRAAGVIGSLAVFSCESYSSNLEDFAKFQTACVVIAFIAWLALTYTGLYVQTAYEVVHNEKGQGAPDRSTAFSPWRLTWQLLTQRNFLTFVTANFLNEFHISYIHNFAGILGDELLQPDILSSTTKSIFFGALNVATSIAIILGTGTVGSVGYYYVYRILLVIKIITGVIMMAFGQSHVVLMAALMSEFLTAGICSSLTAIAISDTIDEDMKTYRRRHPVSSMAWGTNALVTKPANSLAPMLTVAVFRAYGYNPGHSIIGKTPPMPRSIVVMHSVMRTYAGLVPLVIGITQLLVWRMYNIRASHKRAGNYTLSSSSLPT